jgi:hypothetical protein
MYSRIMNENGSLNSRCLYCFNIVVWPSELFFGGGGGWPCGGCAFPF